MAERYRQRELQSRNLGPLLIILVFLILAVGAYSIKTKSWPILPWNITLPAEVEEIAPAGELIEGFPLGLLSIVRDAKVEESHKSLEKGISGQSEILSATFLTKARISDLFGAYINYFTEYGYALKSTQSKEGEASIVAESDKFEVTVNASLSGMQGQRVKIDVKEPVIQ